MTLARLSVSEMGLAILNMVHYYVTLLHGVHHCTVLHYLMVDGNCDGGGIRVRTWQTITTLEH